MNHKNLFFCLECRYQEKPTNTAGIKRVSQVVIKAVNMYECAHGYLLPQFLGAHANQASTNKHGTIFKCIVVMFPCQLISVTNNYC